MSEQWRILVVEDDDNLNQNIVNSLRKDGYLVQGAHSGAEAIRMLWSEEYDVVIGNLKAPGADGFEMLQWLRSYRPNTRMVMVAANNTPLTRTQALEAGVVSYLEKPLNLHLLKEELRRLLQQTGFSANLDSFDLLDVIQIITMSRKSIALLVNTGLEERGILRFQAGELIWAEYGILRGEEAFFALAAHKNGTVNHQLWHEQITPNVTQPLSRLIFQALQYRTKYAILQQATGEQIAVKQLSQTQEIDDSPFLVLAEAQNGASLAIMDNEHTTNASNGDGYKEWWEQTDKIVKPGNDNGNGDSRASATEVANLPAAHGTNIVPATIRKTSAAQHSDLPSWLTEQPTKSNMPMLHPSSLSQTAQIPVTPVLKPSPAEWQPGQVRQPQTKASEPLAGKQSTDAQRAFIKNKNTGRRHINSPEWQPPEKAGIPSSESEALQQLSPAARTTSGSLINSGPLTNTAKLGTQRPSKPNYQALVAALQTVGYSIKGFIAAAVVGLDGHPIAQVAIDDLDISPMCNYFSHILQGALQSLEQGTWGNHEETILTSTTRHMLLRLVGNKRDAFQVLITTRESEPAESLEIMANVEGALAAALR
ncbi:MAG: hypothetical protein NVS4B7_20580 [Ktedonobacteraceae bacterium]